MITLCAENNVFEKDPNAELDYKFDWAALTNGSGVSDWLSSGEKIVSATIISDAGITAGFGILDDDDTSVVVWLSGGTAPATYKIVCRITTDATIPRIDDRTMLIKMVEK